MTKQNKISKETSKLFFDEFVSEESEVDIHVDNHDFDICISEGLLRKAGSSASDRIVLRLTPKGRKAVKEKVVPNPTPNKFKVVSGKVRITDPCYDTDAWCATEILNVKNGNWVASVKKSDQKDWGERCSELSVWHSSLNEGTVFDLPMERVEATIGVDSGQAGIFDSKFYKDDKSVADKGGDEPFYDACCKRTLSDESWGVIPYGAVSSSGFGDGSYDAYIYKDIMGKVVGIQVVFITDDEEEEIA